MQKMQEAALAGRWLGKPLLVALQLVQHSVALQLETLQPCLLLGLLLVPERVACLVQV